MSNPIERFVAMFEPEDDEKIAFRVMLEEALQYIKDKNIAQNENIKMRDYFAAKAMQALLEDDHDCSKWLSKRAYEYADAMIEARSK